MTTSPSERAPRAKSTGKDATDDAANDRVIIIGTGFAGLGMGIKLREAGFENFVILEQASELGGTWRDNHYPGAACDVPTYLYSFSFEPNPSWSRMFGPQSEILGYMNRCADKYGIRSHMRFNAGVVRAAFDERAGLWDVHTSDGTVHRARWVISGTGGLSRPSIPDLPGLASFGGKVFHSARWDHAASLEGKRVAVIGTGASAIQIVPAIAPKVGKLHLFQRTPPWIIPKPDRSIGRREQGLYGRLPGVQNGVRRTLYWIMESFAVGFVIDPRLMKIREVQSLRYLAQAVKDPVLRAKLTPRYTIGCKRILFTNDYYPALQRDNVELVTDGIEQITPTGIRTRDGVERPLDAIVLATGFQASEAVAPFEVRGRDGRDLNTVWRDGAEAFRGTTVSGFPNMFLLVGPNTGLGHSSMILMIESQIQYVVSCLKLAREKKLKMVDVLANAQARYNEELHTRLARTVWASGCSSWYQTRSGKNTTLWPGFTFEFRHRLRRFDSENYELVPQEATARVRPSSEVHAPV